MLTAVIVKNARPGEKDYKLSDSGGLLLYVSTSGHRSWRFKYRFGGKEKRLILGAFPEMSLAEARDRRDVARRQLKDGKDPGLEQRRARLARSTPSELTFESFARQWHDHEKARWTAVHTNDVISSLEKDVFEAIGAFDVTDIDETMVAAVLSKVERRGAVETAHRLRQRISAVFRYAKAKGATKSNPAADLQIVMKQIPKRKRRPALVEVGGLQQLLVTTEHAGASPVTKLGSRFLGLTAQRPGMVRRLPWVQIEGVDWDDGGGDVSNALWRVPAQQMKQEFDLREDDAFEHIVPLAPQAVEVLRAIRPLTSNGPLVFPSGRSMNEPMSENTIGYLYNREGYQRRHCPHGWRSSFSTIMNERTAAEAATDEGKAFNRLVIDLMLAHIPSGISETERVYNRAAYMDRRREIACAWANLLLEGLAPAPALLDGPRRRYKE